jgi:hypothetical protein
MERFFQLILIVAVVLFFSDTAAKFFSPCSKENTTIDWSPNRNYGMMMCSPWEFSYHLFDFPTFLKVFDKNKKLIYQSDIFSADRPIEVMWGENDHDKQGNFAPGVIINDAWIFFPVERDGKMIEGHVCQPCEH